MNTVFGSAPGETLTSTSPAKHRCPIAKSCGASPAYGPVYQMAATNSVRTTRKSQRWRCAEVIRSIVHTISRLCPQAAAMVTAHFAIFGLRTGEVFMLVPDTFLCRHSSTKSAASWQNADRMSLNSCQKSKSHQTNYSWDDTKLPANIAGLVGFFLHASFPLGILEVVHVAFKSAGKS